MVLRKRKALISPRRPSLTDSASLQNFTQN
jgi:hypothetical protein